MEATTGVKVSVVVPVYNKAPYLREAFASIFAQTFTDFELIAVDDRSTDDSLVMLRSFTDPRLRIIALEHNLGPAGAVQRAMDAATGTYIARMDADDLMHPQRLERQVAYMEAHPEVGASSGEVVLFGNDTNRWTFPLTDAACKAQLLFGVPIAQGASILRSAVLRQHGIRYRDEWPRIGEDWLFWVALAPYTRFGNLPVELIRYRRGEQNISHGQDLVAARRIRVPLVMQALGIPITADQVEHHLAASLLLPAPPDAALVGAVHGWLQHLQAWNRRSGHTTEAALAERCAKAWNDLFYRLPPHGWGPVWAHLRRDPLHAWPRLSYALKYWLRPPRQVAPPAAP